jgi:hypothetical protein
VNGRRGLSTTAAHRTSYSQTAHHRTLLRTACRMARAGASSGKGWAQQNTRTTGTLLICQGNRARNRRCEPGITSLLVVERTPTQRARAAFCNSTACRLCTRRHDGAWRAHPCSKARYASWSYTVIMGGPMNVNARHARTLSARQLNYN